MIYRYHEPTGERYLWAPAFGFWIRVDSDSAINEYIRDMLAKWGGEKWEATYDAWLREGAKDDGVPFDGDMFQEPMKLLARSIERWRATAAEIP